MGRGGPWASRRQRTWHRSFGNVRRGCGTAAAATLHTQGPVARKEFRLSLRFPRAGDSQRTTKYASLVLGSGADSPCQGEMSRSDRGGRVGEYGHASAHPELSPVAFCPIPRYSRQSPAKRFCREEEEQGNERSFRCQAETEWSGLCDDELPWAK